MSAFRPLFRTKALYKVPVSILRRYSTNSIVRRNCLIARSQDEMIVARDILIFLLQNMSFPTNVKKSALGLSQKVRVLGSNCGFQGMTVFLPQEKDQVSVREFCRLIQRLSYSGIAALLAPFHYRSHSRQHILEFSSEKNLEKKVCLSQKGRITMADHQSEVNPQKLPSNCKTTNKSSIICISIKGLGTFCQEQR